MAALLIVADDLTGATDTGVQFAVRGIPVRVATDWRETPLDRGAAVLVMNAESRHLEAAEGARRVRVIVERGRTAGIRRFFKKTDSTLRGNVGSELEALLSASGADHLAFVPALPALGRTTRGGVQYVHGRRLHETGFRDDPLGPVPEGSIPDLLRRQTGLPVVTLAVGRLDEHPDAFPSPGILLFDAETDGDVRTIVSWLERRGLLAAVAGTAALARALSDTLPGITAADAPSWRPSSALQPMLVVGGSLNPVSLAQMEHAAAAGFATVSLPAAELIGASSERSAGQERSIEAAIGPLRQGRGVLLRSAETRADAEVCMALGERLGLGAKEVHLRVARTMGGITGRIVAEHPVPVLTVLGGDTLSGVIGALGHPALLPRWELLPGVPVSEVAGTGGMLVVSKAGGFGTPRVLTEIGDSLREMRER